MNSFISGGYFTKMALLLDYKAFRDLIKDHMTKLAPDEQEWLGRWLSFDLYMAFEDDERRRWTRYGHHEGWSSR